MSVKKVKIDKLHVVSGEVPHRTLRRFLMSLVLVIVAISAFAAGLLRGKNDQIISEQERDMLREQYAVLQADYRKLSEASTNLEKGEEIISQAQEICRIDVKQCRQEVAELKSTVTTYRNLMNPDNDEKGLKIQRWEVIDTAVPGRYEYNLVIAQVSGNTRSISGNASVNVVGYAEGKQKIIPLNELLAEKESFRFRMKYLREWKGEFVLPEGFIVDRFEIAVEGTNKNKRVAQHFKWQLDTIASASAVPELPENTGDVTETVKPGVEDE